MSDPKMGVFMREMGADSTAATIEIYGEIGWDISGPILKDIITTMPTNVDEVVFDIYSPGGSVWDGNWMANMIAAMPQRTVADVQVAASMATVIAAACDECKMASNGRFLVHNPWTIAQGDAAEMTKQAASLQATQEEIVDFYAKRTGMKAEDVATLMDEERWMRAPEAAELGFVDTIVDPFEVAAFKGMNKEIQEKGKWPVALADLETTEEEAQMSEEIKVDEEVTDAIDATENTEDVGEDVGEDVVAESTDDAEKIAEDEEPELIAKVELDIVNLEVIQEMRAKAEADEKLIADLRVDLAEARTSKDSAMEEIEARHENERRCTEAKIVELNGRLEKLLPGMAASEDGEQGELPAASWSDAVVECGGSTTGYEKARAKYPELFAQHRAEQKLKRK